MKEKLSYRRKMFIAGLIGLFSSIIGMVVSSTHSFWQVTSVWAALAFAMVVIFTVEV